jgi:ATP-dependent RNA helicase RhlE
VHPVNREQKAQVLAWLIGTQRWKQVLVFTRTKHGADKLVKSLHADGIGAVALHGNKSQNARTRALADFKSGEVEVMVATDIAARGIDIDQLPHVVNYDLPNVPEDYVHRIGRTGRAGNDGEAISLVCVDEHIFLRDIERLIKRTIPKETLPGFEPDPNAVAQTVFAQRGQRQGQGRPGGGAPRHGQPAARDGRNGNGGGNARGSNGSARKPAGSAPAQARSHHATAPRSAAPAPSHDRKHTAPSATSQPRSHGNGAAQTRSAPRQGGSGAALLSRARVRTAG